MGTSNKSYIWKVAIKPNTDWSGFQRDTERLKVQLERLNNIRSALEKESTSDKHTQEDKDKYKDRAVFMTRYEDQLKKVLEIRKKVTKESWEDIEANKVLKERLQENQNILHDIHRSKTKRFQQDVNVVNYDGTKYSDKAKNFPYSGMDGPAGLDADRLKRIDSAMRSLNEEVEDLGKNANKTKSSTDKMGDSVEDLKNSSKNADKGVNDLKKTTVKADDAATKAAGTFKKVAEWSAAAFAFHRITAYVSQGIHALYELDQSLTEIATVTGKTRAEITSLGEEFNRMAVTLGKSTKEIADASVIFFRQGKSQAEVLKLVEASTIAASVAQTDMAETSNFLTATLNGFKLEASEAMAVVDKFSAIGANAGTSFEEVAYGLTKVGASAQNAGVDIDHMMSYIATVSEVTRESAENIGTSFKTMFARMRKITTDPTAESARELNKVEEALNSVNIKLRNMSTGQMRDLQDVIGDLGNSWETLTANQQAYLSTAIAGSRQQSRFISLMDNYSRSTQILDISLNSAGSSLIQFGAHMDGVEAKVKQMRAEFERFWVTLINSDLMKKAVGALTEIIKVLNAMSESGALTVLSMTAIAVAAGKLGKALWIHVPAMLATKAATIELTKRNVELTASNIAATASNYGFAASIKAILASIGPLGWAIMAIGVAITGVTIALTAMERKKRQIADQAKEASDAAKAREAELTQTEALIKQYDELSEKVERTTEEEARLLKVREDLLKTGVDVVDYYDSYGEVVYKSTEAIKELIIKERELNLERAKGAAYDYGKAAADEITKIEKAENALRKREKDLEAFRKGETIEGDDTIPVHLPKGGIAYEKRTINESDTDGEDQMEIVMENARKKVEDAEKALDELNSEYGNALQNMIEISIAKNFSNEEADAIAPLSDLIPELFRDLKDPSKMPDVVKMIDPLLEATSQGVADETTKAWDEFLDRFESDAMDKGFISALTNTMVVSNEDFKKLEETGKRALNNAMNEMFASAEGDEHLGIMDLFKGLNFIDYRNINDMAESVDSLTGSIESGSIGAGDLAVELDKVETFAQNSVGTNTVLNNVMGLLVPTFDDLLDRYFFGEQAARNFSLQAAQVSASIEDQFDTIKKIDSLDLEKIYDTYEVYELVQANSDLYEVLEKTEDGYKINADALELLREETIRSEKATIQMKLNKLQDLLELGSAYSNFARIAISSIESISDAERLLSELNSPSNNGRPDVFTVGNDGEEWNKASQWSKYTEEQKLALEESITEYGKLKSDLALLEETLKNPYSGKDSGSSNGTSDTAFSEFALKYEEMQINEYKRAIADLDAKLADSNMNIEQNVDLLKEKRDALRELIEVERRANTIERREDVEKELDKLNLKLASLGTDLKLTFDFDENGGVVVNEALQLKLDAIEEKYESLYNNGLYDDYKELKEYSDNLEGFISTLNSTANSIEDNQKAIEGTNKALKDVNSEKIKILSEAEKKVKEIIEAEVEFRKEKYEEEYQEFEEFIDKRLQALQDANEEEKRLQRQNDEAREMDEIKQKMLKLEGDTSIEARNKYADLQKELAEKEREQTKNALSDEREDRVAALENAKELEEEAKDSRIENLEEMYDEQAKATLARQALEKNHLDWLHKKGEALVVAYESYFTRIGEHVSIAGEKIRTDFVKAIEDAQKIIESGDLDDLLNFRDSSEEKITMSEFLRGEGKEVQWNQPDNTVSFEGSDHRYTSEELRELGLQLNNTTNRWEGTMDAIDALIEELGYSKLKSPSDSYFSSEQASRISSYVSKISGMSDLIAQLKTSGIEKSETKNNINLQIDKLLNVEGNLDDGFQLSAEDLAGEALDIIKNTLIKNGV